MSDIAQDIADWLAANEVKMLPQGFAHGYRLPDLPKASSFVVASTEIETQNQKKRIKETGVRRRFNPDDFNKRWEAKKNEVETTPIGKKESQRRYVQKNKDKMAEYQKQWRLRQKEQTNEKK